MNNQSSQNNDVKESTLKQILDLSVPIESIVAPPVSPAFTLLASLASVVGNKLSTKKVSNFYRFFVTS